jgi:hypothetical protein
VSQTIAIILRFREESAGEFEAMFERDVLPLWRRLQAAGTLVSASLTPAAGGGRTKPGLRDYILHVEVPSMKEHREIDAILEEMPFLRAAQAMQPEEPLVWFGDTRFRV